MGVMIGPILGPVLGGWLTENCDWRWVFYVNVPVGALCLAILLAELPSRDRCAAAVRPVRLRDDRARARLRSSCCSTAATMLDWFASVEIWIYAFVVAVARRGSR